MNFLIPAFMNLLIHSSSWSLIFLIPAFMDLVINNLPGPFIHGSFWSLCLWIFLMPALMDLPDPCDQEDQWSERSMNQKIHKNNTGNKKIKEHRNLEFRKFSSSPLMDLLWSSWFLHSWIFLIHSWDCLIINLLDPCVHWSSSSFNQQTLPMLLLLILMITILLNAEW